MKSHYNVVVVGLGAIGSATLYHLAKQGVSVLGIDQFNPPHTHGSTHGETRLTRLANGEGAEYTALALRARDLWQQLEQASGKKLLVENGVIIFGSPAPNAPKGQVPYFLKNTIAQAQQFSIPYTQFTPQSLQKAFPQFSLRGDEIGYLEPTGGFLYPEACVEAELSLAQKHGATILTNTMVHAIDMSQQPVIITTAQGVITADQVVVTAGPWLSTLFPEFEQLCAIYRQVVIWFKLSKQAAPLFTVDRLPAFKWKFEEEELTEVYGFPILNAENPVLKVGIETYNQKINIKDYNPVVDAQTVQQLYHKFVGHRIPILSGEYEKAAACMYTVVDKLQFIIDRHPRNHQVIIASPCSGHGFKHSIAVGEILANLCTNKKQAVDISAFAIPQGKL